MRRRISAPIPCANYHMAEFDYTNHNDQQVPVNIEDEMRKSYLDYAMSVIIGRALPDVRDGLKPGAPPHPLRHVRAGEHRRQGVQEIGAHRRRRHGQVPSARRQRDLRLGRAHGPGLLDALRARRRPGQLRLASTATTPAAMRYTEVRLTKLAEELMRDDIDKETVDFVPNYDGTAQRALGPSGEVPEPARQRLVRHRRRHGHEHPAAQPRRSDRRLPDGDREPEGVREGADDGHARSRFPDRPASFTASRESTRHTRPAAASFRCARAPSSRHRRRRQASRSS